jgi:rfaE bifunctional protein kinase chain/domain
MSESRRLRELVSRFSTARILVVGDVMLDEYVWGEVRRVSPEAPVPVVEFRRSTATLGGAGNVAANIAALGAAPALVAVVGDDEAGLRIRESAQALGIRRLNLQVEPERRTTCKTRILAHSQQLLRLDRENTQPISVRREEQILAAALDLLSDSDVCVLSDYAKGLITATLCQKMIRAARDISVPTLVDPKSSDWERYKGATLITPNRHEAIATAHRHGMVGDGDVAACGPFLASVVPDTTVLVTLGPDGVVLFSRDSGPGYEPSVARDVFDVTGAGDTLIAAVAVALGAGATIREAVRIGNAAAGLAVGKLGTATVSCRELLSALSLQDEPDTTSQPVMAGEVGGAP